MPTFLLAFGVLEWFWLVGTRNFANGRNQLTVFASAISRCFDLMPRNHNM